MTEMSEVSSVVYSHLVDDRDVRSELCGVLISRVLSARSTLQVELCSVLINVVLSATSTSQVNDDKGPTINSVVY